MPGIKIVQFHAPLYYANVDKFKSTIFKTCNSVSMRKKLSNAVQQVSDFGKCELTYDYLILNCNSVLYIDLMGVNALKQVIKKYLCDAVVTV